jgi:hypothetical protein
MVLRYVARFLAAPFVKAERTRKKPEMNKIAKKHALAKSFIVENVAKESKKDDNVNNKTVMMKKKNEITVRHF